MNLELATERVVAAVAIEYLLIADERTEKARPPPSDNTADAPSIYEISSRIWFLSFLICSLSIAESEDAS